MPHADQTPRTLSTIVRDPPPAESSPATAPAQQGGVVQDRLKQAKALRLKEQLKNKAQKEEPGLIESAFKGLDDLVRSIATGMTANTADEAAASLETLSQRSLTGQPSLAGVVEAGMSAFTGGNVPEQYERNLEAERARDRDIPAGIAVPGQLVGGLATGGGLARQGATLLKGARPTLPSLGGRGAAEGAAYGAAYGAGHAEGGPRERAEGAARGSALGAATGALTGAASRPFVGKPSAPASQAVKEQAGRAYDTAEQAGVIVKGDSFKRAVDRIEQKLAKAGVDKTIHPKAMAAFNRLKESADNNQTLKGLDLLRRVVKGAAASNDRDERRIARIMIDELDDYIGGLKPSDVLTGNAPKATAALKEARKLWSRSRKGEIVEELIERAGNRAGQFTGSGYENALRTEFRNLVQNPKRLRLFTPEEQKTLRKVARGGPIGNALRFLGKFAPRGVVSGGFGVGMGAAAGDPIVTGGVFAAGELGRRGATAATARNAQQALDKVLGAYGKNKSVTLSPKEIGLLRSLLIAEIQAEQAAVPAPSRPTPRGP